MPVAIREMAPGDLDQVLSVERQAFAGPERHGLRAFTRCMRHRQGLALMAEGDFGVGLGEPAEHIIVGWMLGYVRCRGFHVEYLAVLPDMQRKGIGRGLLQPAFELARQAPVAKPRVTLHVRERNLAAQKFYQALGFRAARVLRGFYDDGQGEDAGTGRSLCCYRSTKKPRLAETRRGFKLIESEDVPVWCRAKHTPLGRESRGLETRRRLFLQFN